jgi:hypothetical protein
MAMVLRIAKVDMDGYCGRDHHPTREMEGELVLVRKMEVEQWGDEPGYAVFYAVRFDGSLVELIGHEVKLARFDDDVYRIDVVASGDGARLPLDSETPWMTLDEATVLIREMDATYNDGGMPHPFWEGGDIYATPAYGGAEMIFNEDGAWEECGAFFDERS